MAQEAEFLELCKAARELERRAMDIPPTPISGNLVHAGSDIFPKEFEDYTYSYLLVEAHKIERKLFATTYRQELVSSTSDSQMARELSSFASDGSYGQSKDGSEFPKAPSVKTPSPMQPPSEDSSSSSEGQPPPEDFPLPSHSRNEIEIARETEEEGEKRLARLRAPKQMAQREKVEEGAEEETNANSEGEPIAAKEEPPQRQFAASSKLSPRLRAIIEAKLRREEEKEKEEAEAKAAPEQSETSPEELQPSSLRQKPKQTKVAAMPLRREMRGRMVSEAEGQGGKTQETEEEPEPQPLSARERLLRRLQRETQEAKKKREFSPPSRQEMGEEKDPQGQLSESKEIEGEKPPERQLPETNELPAAKEEEPGQAQQTTQQEAPMPKASLFSRSPHSGSLLIKPLFAGEREEGKESEEPTPHDTARLDKIQRIIDELSGDRHKASAVSKPREEISPVKEIPAPKPAAELSEAEMPSEDEEASESMGEGLQGQQEGESESALEDEEKRKQEIRRKMEAIFKRPQLAAKERKVAPPPAQEGPEENSEPQEEQETPLPTSLAAKKTPIKKLPAGKAAKLPASKGAKAPAIKKGKGKEIPKKLPAAGKKPTKSLGGSPPISKEYATKKAAGKMPPLSKAPSPPPIPSIPASPSSMPPSSKSRMAYPTSSSEPPSSVKKLSPPSLSQKPSPQTYLPPLRQKPPPTPPQGEDEGEKEEVPIPREVQPPDLYEEKMPPKLLLLKRAVKEPAQENEETDIPLPPAPRPQEIDLLALAKRKKEISGEAALGKDDELEAPRPPPPEEDLPAPQQYGQAKEDFKRKMEQAELKEKAKGESDELVEAYAKENITWLYDIYKMGGLSREDFLSKAKEKMDAPQMQEGQEEEPPPNPALEALSKEIEKKKK